MKSKKSKTTKYFAYVDETCKEGVTYAIALLIEEREARRLDQRWKQLRADLAGYMRRKSYPLAQKFLSDPSFLPEIHAAHLYGSSGYFRFDNPADPNYWTFHRDVLSEAVNIIARARPVILMGSSKGIDRNTSPTPSKNLASNLKYKKMKDRMDRLYFSPYVSALNILITVMEEYSQKHDIEIVMHCDNHDDGRGFSALETFRISSKLYPQFKVSAPQFHDSAASNFLQAADVAAYVFVTSYTDWKTLKYLPPKDTSRWKMTLDQYMHFETIGDHPLVRQRMVSRLLELVITQSGGPAEYQQLVRGPVSEMIQKILEGDSMSHRIKIDNEGLRFFEQAEMYRPPSEDGDLSE